MRIAAFATVVLAAACSLTAHGQIMGTAKAPGDALPTDYFSTDYATARHRFLEAAQAAGVRVESIRHPDTGPNGGPLYTDVALIGPGQASRILMLVSATHGIEGFAGSGIQTGLLRDGIAARLGPDLAIVMVHALNPYGFAHLRRVNEDNVDVNRNFVDHSLRYPDNPGYERLADALAPKRLSFSANLAAGLSFLWFRLTEGKARRQCAITAGQYTHPDGLFYGGNGETWSNRTIRNIVRDYLSHAQQVAIIGLHTGLGPCAEAEIILNEPKTSPAYRRAVAWWGDARTRTTVTGEAVSCHLSGPLKLA